MAVTVLHALDVWINSNGYHNLGRIFSDDDDATSATMYGSSGATGALPTFLGSYLEAYDGATVATQGVIYARVSATSRLTASVRAEFDVIGNEHFPGGRAIYVSSTDYFTVPADGAIHGVAMPVGAALFGTLDQGVRTTPGLEVYLEAGDVPPGDPRPATPNRTLTVYQWRLELGAPDEDPWLRAVQRSDGQGAGGPPRAVQQATRADSLRAGTAAI